VENQKPKSNKTPFIHPSLAAGGAKRGTSRIAPGSQKGAVIYHDAPPEVARGVAVVEPPPSFEFESEPEPAAQATASPTSSPVSGAEAAAAAERRRNDVISKLLLFTQPLIKSVEIGGMLFRFRIITPADSAHVGKILSSFPDAEQTILKNRMLNLAASIVDVDGVTLESIYTGPLVKDLVLIRYSELMKWSNPVLNGVLSAQEKLVEDVRQEYLPDFLKQPKKESIG
jgi:hypothetical protein